MEKLLTDETLEAFAAYLIREEMSAATVEKYVRDCRAFLRWAKEAGGQEQEITITKELLMN